MAMPKILYIMGTGRTGTTILEVLLKDGAGIFGAGEVTHIFRDGYLADKSCSCGKPASRCEVWRSIRRNAQWSNGQIHDGRRLFRRIESHTRFPLLATGLVGRSAMRAYGQLNRDLYESAYAATGAEVVVDSSKYAGRALALARTMPDIRVICITRSPAGLIKTYRKHNKGEQRRQPALFVAVYYAYVLLCMRIVRSLLGQRCLTIRYEDLRNRPASVLQRIGVWGGVDVTSAVRKIEQGEAFDVGHIVTGNRLRKQGKVRYRVGNEAQNVDGVGANLIARLLKVYRSALGF